MNVALNLEDLGSHVIMAGRIIHRWGTVRIPLAMFDYRGSKIDEQNAGIGGET